MLPTNAQNFSERSDMKRYKEKEEDSEPEEIVGGKGLVDPVKGEMRGEMYLQKDGKCCRVQKLGGSLVLTPRKCKSRDGVFVKVGKLFMMLDMIFLRIIL